MNKWKTTFFKLISKIILSKRIIKILSSKIPSFRIRFKKRTNKFKAILKK